MDTQEIPEGAITIGECEDLYRELERATSAALKYRLFPTRENYATLCERMAWLIEEWQG